MSTAGSVSAAPCHQLYKEEIVGRRVQVKFSIDGGKRTVFFPGTVQEYRCFLKLSAESSTRSLDDDVDVHNPKRESSRRTHVLHRQHKILFDDGDTYFYDDIEDWEQSGCLKWLATTSPLWDNHNVPPSFREEVVGRRVQVKFSIGDGLMVDFFPGTIHEYCVFLITAETLEVKERNHSELAEGYMLRGQHVIQFDDGEVHAYDDVESWRRKGNLQWLPEASESFRNIATSGASSMASRKHCREGASMESSQVRSTTVSPVDSVSAKTFVLDSTSSSLRGSIQSPTFPPEKAGRVHEILFNYACSTKYSASSKVHSYLQSGVDMSSELLISMMDNCDILHAIKLYMKETHCSISAIKLACSYWEHYDGRGMIKAQEDPKEKLSVLAMLWSNLVILAHTMNEYYDAPDVTAWRTSVKYSRDILMDFDKEVLELLMNKEFDLLLAVHKKRYATSHQKLDLDPQKEVRTGMKLLAKNPEYTKLVKLHAPAFHASKEKSIYLENVVQTMLDDGWYLVDVRKRSNEDQGVLSADQFLSKFHSDIYRYLKEEGYEFGQQNITSEPPKLDTIRCRKKEIIFGASVALNTTAYKQLIQANISIYKESESRFGFVRNMVDVLLKSGWQCVWKRKVGDSSMVGDAASKNQDLLKSRLVEKIYRDFKTFDG